MGWFKKPQKEEIKVQELTLTDLRDKVIELKKTNNKIDSRMAEELNSLINNLLSNVKQLNNSVVNEEVSRTLLIGVNNSRRLLCNTLELITTKKPDNLNELNDYLIDIEKYLSNSYEIYSKHSGKVGFVYKKEMTAVNTSLNSLTDKVKEIKSRLTEKINLINSIYEINNELTKHESLINESINNIKDMRINEEKINESIIKKDKLNNELISINNSPELTEELNNKREINKLNDELKNLEFRGGILFDDFSKALKRHSRDSNDDFVNSLIVNPLNALSKSGSEFNKLKESLLKELDSGALGLKDKQLIKAKDALINNELITLADKYSEINLRINSLSNNELITKKDNLEYEIDTLSDYINQLNSLKNSLIMRNESISNEKESAIKDVESKGAKLLNTELKISHGALNSSSN